MSRKHVQSSQGAYTNFLIGNAVRNNTNLESLHCGITPSSKTGDFSDVKVVTPYGEIPWNELSRISDEEMKAFMIRAASNLHTLMNTDPAKLSPFMSIPDWQEPLINEDLLRP